MTKKPTQKQKIEMYEGLLHDINMFAAVAMNPEMTSKLIGNICDWSYAFRQGNGEFSDKEQQKLINDRFWSLRNRK
jgi:hypothetical protein